MDIASIEMQFDEWERRYREWREPIDRFLRENSPRVNKDGYTTEDLARGLQSIHGADPAHCSPIAAIHSLLNRITADYLSALPEDRAALRAYLSRPSSHGDNFSCDGQRNASPASVV